MAGVTKEEISRAKELDLLTYFKLVEPGNLKLVGKEYRHKIHSSLTISKDSLWCWHCIGLHGRTALKYLIDVEKVPYVEAVREINRIQGGVVHSSQPVSLPQPWAEPEVPRDFKLPNPDANSYAAMAYLRGRCIHPNVLAFCRKESILYQTSFKNHPNCVFVGRDGEGVAKGGSLRGCTQLQFRRDIPGSKKIYPFYIQASAKADSRAVYRDRYQFGDKIGKTMYLRGIAPEMKNGLFSMLSELPFDHVITMHVDAMDQAEAVQEIEKKLAYMHKEEYEAIAKARERNMPASIAVSYDLKSKMHHTEQMMDDITTKNQKIFKVCILIHTYGDSNAQLDERVRRICSTVQQQTCRFDSILYEQRNAMNSMLPLGKKWLGLERTLETVSTAIYVPFTTQELFQPGGLYEGINARSKNLILCNRKLLPAPAGMVLGMTGYGKSFSVMQMVTNIMLRWPDDDIVLIDPEQ